MTHKDRDLELMKAAKEDGDCPCVTRLCLKSIARFPTTSAGPLEDIDATYAGHWVLSRILHTSSQAKGSRSAI